MNRGPLFYYCSIKSAQCKDSQNARFVRMGTIMSDNIHFNKILVFRLSRRDFPNGVQRRARSDASIVGFG